MSDDLRCGALTQAGAWCQHRAVAATDWWRCAKHADWHDKATPAERFRLAELQLEELMSR